MEVLLSAQHDVGCAWQDGLVIHVWWDDMSSAGRTELTMRQGMAIGTKAKPIWRQSITDCLLEIRSLNSLQTAIIGITNSYLIEDGQRIDDFCFG